MGDEWERVLQNPDNMIVSDSLKERVAALLSEGEPEVRPAYEVRVSYRDRSLSMELLRVDLTRDGVEIVGSCGPDAVSELLAVETDGWRGVEVMQDGSLVRSFDLQRREVRASLDLSSALGPCIVTLSWCRIVTKQVL